MKRIRLIKKKKERKKPDPPNRLRFTQAKVENPDTSKLKPMSKQFQVWDTQQRGLSILVNTSGSKLYRATYRFGGKLRSEKLGRTDEISLTTAREMAKAKWEQVFEGFDPKIQTIKATTKYKDVVKLFIDQYARPNQRSWRLTQGALLKTCSAWLDRPFSKITKADANTLLTEIKETGQVYKAAVAYAWIRKLWKWAAQFDHVPINRMATLPFDFDRRERDLTYDSDQIKAIWNAANTLSAEEAAYVKLLLLLVPRKTALASALHSHFGENLDRETQERTPIWTTPFELTKSKLTSKKKRTYVTPLPKLAQRILQSIPKQEGNDRVFPSMPNSPGKRFKTKLVKAGAPANFMYHAVRHTAATWLEEKGGYTELEIAPILNHSGTTTVTTGYIRARNLKRKLEMLEEWGSYVEKLVTPAGTVLLHG